MRQKNELAPTRGRELKQDDIDDVMIHRMLAPTRGRELKLKVAPILFLQICVRPPHGA